MLQPPKDPHADTQEGGGPRSVKPASPPPSQPALPPPLTTTTTSAVETSGGFCSTVSFKALCEVLDRIASATGKKEQLQLVENLWRRLRAVKAPPSEHHQILRLLMPQLDSKRATYGLKESKMARFYVELLGLSDHSPDAIRFKNWKDPSKSSVETTSFSDVIFVMLTKRGFTGEGRGISIHECNAALDALSAAESIDRRKQIMMGLMRAAGASEQRWLIRIITKEMRMRLSHTAILSAFHPQATEQFNCTNDLLHVCEKCMSESALAAAGPLAAGGVGLMRPFKPMLAAVVESDKLQVLLRDEKILVEPKFDGERLLVHYHRPKSTATESAASSSSSASASPMPRCSYFTRNCKDYTAAYGPKLTPAVQAFFASCTTPVSNCILDSEVLLYDKARKTYVPFGQNRTFALGGVVGGAASNSLDGEEEDRGGSTQQPPNAAADGGHEFHLMVFDVVYLNNESLCTTPLDRRKACLRQLFKLSSGPLANLASTVKLVPFQAVTTIKEILVCMDDALGRAYEGVMIKLAASHYVPGERKTKWTKLKPDHISGIADTLDLVVLGAYYGTKYGQRRLSHFLLGAPDNNPSDAASGSSSSSVALNRKPQQAYKTVCKVGSGYNDAELAEILAATDGKWFALPPGASSPSWLGGWKPGAGEVPDVYIDPAESVVMEVYGYSFQETTKFALGLTIRFPRYSRLRFDKGINDANDVTSLHNIAAASGQFLKRVQDLGGLTMIRKERHKERKTAGKGLQGRAVGSSLLPTRAFVFGSRDNIALPDAASVQRLSSLFDGYEFCVLQTTMEVAERSELERLLLAHGGAVVANPQKHTSVVLAVSRMSTKVQNWMNACAENPTRMGDDFMTTDLVHVKWALQCIASRRLLPFAPHLMVYTSPSLQARFDVALDEFKDSYFDPCTTESLAHSMRLAGSKRSRSEVIHVSDDVGSNANSTTVADQVRQCKELIANVNALRWRVLGPAPQVMAPPEGTCEADNDEASFLTFPRVNPSTIRSHGSSPDLLTDALLGLSAQEWGWAIDEPNCLIQGTPTPDVCASVTKFLS